MTFTEAQTNLNNFRSQNFDKLLEYGKKLERLQTAGYPDNSLEILSLKREYGKDVGGLLDKDEELVLMASRAKMARDANKPRRRRSDSPDAQREYEKQQYGHFDEEAGYKPKIQTGYGGKVDTEKYRRPGDKI